MLYTIKPLEWKRKTPIIYDDWIAIGWEASTRFGTYEATLRSDKDIDGTWLKRVEFRYCFREYHDEGAFPAKSIRHAKALAEKHWVGQLSADLVPRVVLKKVITYMGAPTVLVCDGRCDKAWGQHNRPCTPDRRKYLTDDELGTAPAIPDTEEGGDIKPSAVPLQPDQSNLMNRWCARECERSTLCTPDRQPSLY